MMPKYLVTGGRLSNHWRNSLLFPPNDDIGNEFVQWLMAVWQIAPVGRGGPLSNHHDARLQTTISPFIQLVVLLFDCLVAR